MAAVESLNFGEISGDLDQQEDRSSSVSDKETPGKDTIERKPKQDSDEEGEASDDGEITTNGKSGDMEEGELEEGEVGEEEGGEGEKKEVCKYFFKGQCTWGSNCRFIHVSGTDKGNYNMFEELKKAKEEPKPTPKPPRARSPLPGLAPLSGMKGRLPMIPPDFFPSIPEQPRRESAWERSTRQAKHLAQSAAKKRDALEDNLHGFGDTEIESEFFNEEKSAGIRHPPRSYIPFNRQDFEVMMNRERRNNQQTFFNRNFDRRRESPPPPVDSRRNIQNNRQMYNRQRNADEWQDPWMRSRSPGRKRDTWQRKASASPVSRSRSASGSDKVSRNSRSPNRSRSKEKPYRRSGSRKRNAPARSPSGSPISSKSSHSSLSKSPAAKPVEKQRSPASSHEANGKRKRASSQRSAERGRTDYNRNDNTQSPSLSNVSDSEDGPRTPPPEDPDDEQLPQHNHERSVRRNRSPSPVSPEGDLSSLPVDNFSDEPSLKKQKKTHKPIKLTLQTKGDRRTAASSAFRGYDDEEEDDPVESPNPLDAVQLAPSKTSKSSSIEKDRTSPLSDEDCAQKSKQTAAIPEEKAQKREELLRQLRAVEEAIARKKATKTD